MAICKSLLAPDLVSYIKRKVVPIDNYSNTERTRTGITDFIILVNVRETEERPQDIQTNLYVLPRHLN